MTDNKAAVITGANRGIGLELARHYAREGWNVIGVCRQTSDELSGVAAKVIDNIDVTTDSGISKLKNELAGQTIDLLINNAGLLQDEKLGSIDFDSIRTQMEINAYAPLRVAEALVSQIPSGGLITPEESAKGLAARIEGLSLENTGSFWHSNGEELPW
ncbi:SDR family NAD(P)-dependent oxidoreductase [Marinobacter sp. Arc7-DN-1]|uniref:SDR family NAD(P)-dependent oxidoreductase n=1 Tax=Marinobacter sp. Arc7-DN-1 TaxID=2304594 RepID=UPI000E43BC04|nr:SDR family NAD(P)-dependent oxidoreductase [Marinobacter sp. Arc7-DN-1]AXS84806.1 SDR family NAD(P)-dependent oxidoreductase [Marinobacter sp. Arc7-DN-1]